MIMNLINFAIDFGNGYVKAKSDKGEYVFSSKLAYADELGDSSLSNEFNDDLNVSTFQRKDEPLYVYGADIESAIKPESLITTNSNNNRYALTSFKRLVDFALAELASYEEETNINVRLVTGMPSNELKMSEKYEVFSEYLQGNHLITRNGVDYVINVAEVRVIEQPLGTLLNIYLNDELQVHQTFKNGLVVVIDFGSGTTIVDIFNNMKRTGGRTLNSGMIDFHKSIAQALSVKQSIDINPIYIEEGIRNKTYLAKFGNQSVSFKELFDNQVSKVIESIIQIYENEIGQESLVNDFIVTGGGAQIIGDQLTKLKPNFNIVDNSQTSTVDGYFKLSQKLRKAD